MTAFRVAVLVLTALALAAPAAAQRPQPFPTPGQQAPRPPQAPQTPLLPTAPPEIPSLPQDPASPTDATLGMPIYPAAQFLASYDAGRGQRYYVFGTTATFEAIVAYYRTQLDEGGDRVFNAPPTHVFEYGRFDDDEMAFPPGVTVKDWTWGGSLGYPNPRPDATLGIPDRFPTVFVMVPQPAATMR